MSPAASAKSNRSPTKRIYAFFGKVFLWLVPCFIFWFLCTRLLNIPLEWLATHFLSWLTNDVIFDANMHYTGAIFNDLVNQQFKLETIIPAPDGSDNNVFGVARPLIYGYGLPVFAALTLATPKIGDEKWRDVIIAYVVFLLIQLFGITCQSLMQLVFYSPPAISNYFPQVEQHINLLGICYQLATLLFPPVTPVMLWIFLNTEFIESLVGKKLHPQKDNSYSPSKVSKELSSPKSNTDHFSE